jgi:hypothetical protein
MSIVIVKRLISGYDMTTLMMIVCIPVILPSDVSYAKDSFFKHYA